MGGGGVGMKWVWYGLEVVARGMERTREERNFNVHFTSDIEMSKQGKEEPKDIKAEERESHKDPRDDPREGSQDDPAGHEGDPEGEGQEGEVGKQKVGVHFSFISSSFFYLLSLTHLTNKCCIHSARIEPN